MSKLATKYKFKGLDNLAVTNTNKFVLLPRTIGFRNYGIKYITPSKHMGVMKIYYNGNRYDEKHLKELKYSCVEDIEVFNGVVIDNMIDRLSAILD
ncbi:hypothetical protein N9928_01190 [bacterium]|nr:hypothetical protein [bacterium]